MFGAIFAIMNILPTSEVDTNRFALPLDKIKSVNSDIPVIMLSAQDEIDIAITCMSHKAFDYVIKNSTDLPRLKKVIIPFLIEEKS